MSELREKLTYMAQEYGEPGSEILTSDFVNAILSLLNSSPTEFEAVRKCPECDYGWVCKHCNSTGEIVRLLTQKEVMAWAGDVADWDNNEGPSLMYFPTLKTGERVRIKP